MIMQVLPFPSLGIKETVGSFLRYIYLAKYTSLIEIIGKEKLLSLRRAVIVFRHADIFLLAMVSKRYLKSNNSYLLAINGQSAQFDHELIRRLGGHCILLDSNTNNFHIIKNLVEKLKEDDNFYLLFAFDGPLCRGKNNGSKFARLLSASLILVDVETSREESMSTWDRRRVPLPFSYIKYQVRQKM